MLIQIVGAVDVNRLFCAGSFTKLVTTYVALSVLSEKYSLNEILNADDFFDKLCVNSSSQEWLSLFQKILGTSFSLHDICSYYAGLPYTFDVTAEQLKKVEAGYPFKHHNILDLKEFLSLCHQYITPIYPPKSKFHYSELSIIFLGYLIEQVYSCKMEDLYDKYVINKFDLKNSLFSRKKPEGVYTRDFSDKYDYPSIAILDHGYFCYSNGFFTTLNDMKILLEKLFLDPVFNHMIDIKNARAASNTIMNGLAVEIRMHKGDILYGYEGMSYSGCNIWACSAKKQYGYLTFIDDEEKAYEIYHLLDANSFDRSPDFTNDIYKTFIKNYDDTLIEKREIPRKFQGNYQRVKINEKILNTFFVVGDHFIIIRNPDKTRYNVIYVKGNYHIQGKDNLPGAKIGFLTSSAGNQYMYHDGTLYKKMNPTDLLPQVPEKDDYSQ